MRKALRTLDPAKADHVPVERWESFSRELAARLPSASRRTAEAFLLAVGLRRGAEGARLCLRHFPSVHAHLARDNSDHPAWTLLAPELPDLGLWRRWDRCESLRRAVAERAARHHWPPRELFAALRGERLFRAFLETCRGAAHGRALLRRMAEHVRERPSSASPGQRRALASLPPSAFIEFERRCAPRAAA